MQRSLPQEGFPMGLKQSLIIITACWPVIASAGDSFVTGNKLFDYCRERSESCTSYIAGVTDSLLMVDITMNKHIVCIPDNVLLGQTVDVTMNYLRSHPEGRQFSAASLVIVALSKAFPCNK
jgi:hypothetical protein